MFGFEAISIGYDGEKHFAKRNESLWDMAKKWSLETDQPVVHWFRLGKKPNQKWIPGMYIFEAGVMFDQNTERYQWYIGSHKKVVKFPEPEAKQMSLFDTDLET